MAEQRVRLSESERLALDFMIAALREGDDDTASLAFDGQEAAYRRDNPRSRKSSKYY